MSPIVVLVTATLLAAALAGTPGSKPDAEHPRVALDTSLGRIVIELDAQKAPKSVANFLAYVRSGFYDGTIFHRVIRGFMIQGGGLDQQMTKKPTRPPIPNEAANGLRNTRGTVAMARTNDPNSATAQFFVNTVDNRSLDFRDATVAGYGYAVFGRVVEGMDVVDAIEKVPTTSRQGNGDVPVEPVVIRKATVVE